MFWKVQRGLWLGIVEFVIVQKWQGRVLVQGFSFGVFIFIYFLESFFIYGVACLRGWGFSSSFFKCLVFVFKGYLVWNLLRSSVYVRGQGLGIFFFVDLCVFVFFLQVVAEWSKIVIFVKNLSAGILAVELQEIFGRFGSLGRVFLFEGGVIVIVEFLEFLEVRKVFRYLVYFKVGCLGLVLGGG